VADAEACMLIKMLLYMNKSSAQFQVRRNHKQLGKGSCWQENNEPTYKPLIKLHEPRGVCKSKKCEKQPGKTKITSFL